MKTNFVDPIGRISDKPKTQELGITDNPNLFTGELLLLQSLLGKLEVNDVLCVSRELYRIQVKPGLYHRHPQWFIQEYPNLLHPNMVSHDEYNGLCFTDIATDNRYKIAQDIVNYGKSNGWQFADYYPNANFYKYFFSHPIKAIKGLSAYLKDRKNNPSNLDLVDFRHPADIVSITYVRQPRDVAFYKICAGENPSLLEVLWLSIATVLTSKKDVYDGSRGGTILLAWFRMLAIQKKGYSHSLLNLAHQIFQENLEKRFGPRYPAIIAAQYFDRVADNGEVHPIRGLINLYLDQQNKK